MNADGKSDESIVPAKHANNGAAEASAERVEESDSTKRNVGQANLPRAQDWNNRKSSRLHYVREAARKDSTLKFTNLLHHVSEDCLIEAFFNLKKSAAAGVDGITWQDYEHNLEANIADLHDRVHRGARFAKFGLKLHEGKTRLIEFGRYAIERRAERGEGRPDTFDFLGFTHCCAKTRKHGWFTIRRQSIAKRMRATLQAIKDKLRKRMHRPLGETSRWLGHVVQGWLNYHAVPGNSHRIGRFVDEVTRMWLHILRRRSQLGRQRWTWARMQRFVRKHLPRPRIIHPYPKDRFRVRLKVGAV